MNKKNYRWNIIINGRVQGVGMRPYIYRLATEMSLAGWIRNTQNGVEIEIESSKNLVNEFKKKLSESLPQKAYIQEIFIKQIDRKNEKSFLILTSIPYHKNEKYLSISPDIAMCNKCKKELLNPADKRYLYPFINCTDCGPRFSISSSMPYDRKKTTMSEFTMCDDCKKEYENPADRRFHAETNTCPDCGPQVFLTDNKSQIINTKNPIYKSIKLLKNGKILAIKGIGGFHLACDATNSIAVKKLRILKKRRDKPFAIMVKDLLYVRKLCKISKQEAHILNGQEHPIVLLKQKKSILHISPGNNKLGIMLPYTPMHYLLFHYCPDAILVMTSGNKSEEPIAASQIEAYENLSLIADYFLMHNRKIYNRMDDSIVQIAGKNSQILRSSRGFTPTIISFSKKSNTPCILAFGADMKSSFAILNKKYVYISQYIGELNNSKTIDFYTEMLNKFLNITGSLPDLISHDLHPDYISTRLAMEFADKKQLPIKAIQHHHTHICSVMAEYSLNAPVIGVAFDGTGMGLDGNIWGGDFFIINKTKNTNLHIERIAHIDYFPLPGGDKAVKEIWRPAHAIARTLGKSTELPYFNKISKEKINLINNMLDEKLNVPMTSSMGRLFDIVAALIGLRYEITFEGQAAIELESLVKSKPNSFYEFELIAEDAFIIDINRILIQIIEDVLNKKNIVVIAEKFHLTIVHIISSMCEILRNIYYINTIVLSGGVFQNQILVNWIYHELNKKKFDFYFNRKIPTNDAGIAIGQLWAASNNIKSG
ncbi:carbamoyltransferase HypF [Candidatus Poribacteria bacterium]|nr:carbamoyltransferase HypF [Candidatus Poribacteria bacterium]